VMALSAHVVDRHGTPAACSTSAYTDYRIPEKR
jgi:hypothetical protein